MVRQVHAGVQQFVRRQGAAPAGQRVPHTAEQGLGGDQVAAGRQQPVEPPGATRQRARGRLRVGASPRRQPVQQALAGEGEVGPERRHGMPLHRRPAGEPHAQQLADGRPPAVAADHVTPAPPDALGLRAARGVRSLRGRRLARIGGVRLVRRLRVQDGPGVDADAGLVLFYGVQPPARGDPHQLAAGLLAERGQRGAQRSGEHVLGEVERRGDARRFVRRGRVTRGRERRRGVRGPAPWRLRVVEGHLTHRLAPAHGAPPRPAGTAVGGDGASEAAQHLGGVRPEHCGTGGALLVYARPAGPLVEKDDGDVTAGESQRQREANGARAHDDHRVHGAVPPSLRQL